MKLGKKPKRTDKRTLKFKTYIGDNLPLPPTTIDFYNVMTDIGMMLNDTEGDCTIAAAGHMIQEWTANTGTQKILPDSVIQSAYNANNGGTDGGCVMLDVLNYWRQTGIGGDTVTAFTEVTAGENTELMDAVYLGGALYIGLALPSEVVSGDLLNADWTKVYGPPDSSNGHCVPVVGYDIDNVYVVTWGTIKPMSWEFYTTYCDEAYCVVSDDWIGTSGETPEGFNMTQLLADVKQITS